MLASVQFSNICFRIGWGYKKVLLYRFFSISIVVVMAVWCSCCWFPFLPERREHKNWKIKALESNVQFFEVMLLNEKHYAIQASNRCACIENHTYSNEQTKCQQNWYKCEAVANCNYLLQTREQMHSKPFRYVLLPFFSVFRSTFSPIGNNSCCETQRESEKKCAVNARCDRCNEKKEREKNNTIWEKNIRGKTMHSNGQTLITNPF